MMHFNYKKTLIIVGVFLIFLFLIMFLIQNQKIIFLEGKTIKTFSPVNINDPISIIKKILPYPTNEPELVPEKSLNLCKDTDDLDFYNKGEVYYTRSNEPNNPISVTFTDYCASRRYLNEYFCDKEEFKIKTHSCEWGCKDGRCLFENEIDRGIVYVVFAVDTETVNFKNDVYNQTLETWNFYTGNESDESDFGIYVYKAMNESFRYSVLDSFENNIKISWFLLTHEAYCYSSQEDCLIIHTIMDSFSKQAEKYGDIYEWHYHNSDWSDYDNDGIYFWNQLLTFNNTNYYHGTDIELAEKMLAMQILDKEFYPSVYRAGWTWENNDLSNWLDDLIPFDFSNLAPEYNRPNILTDPLYNWYDWNRALRDWSFYNPYYDDYQFGGDLNGGNLKRVIFRCMPPDLSNFYKAFNKAYFGEDSIVCTYAHSSDKLVDVFPASVNELEALSKDYPGVKFKFVNALEGAKIMLNYSDNISPIVNLINKQQDIYEFYSNELLFSYPFGAVKDANGNYKRVKPINLEPDALDGIYKWTFDLTNINYQEFAVAGLDEAGNIFVTEKITKE